ncbi:MAG: hypothetical protein HKO90_07915 [Flavobacteriaceae bacterium]|nr:hypothetical protein [Bacteroidia bacterium]NNK88195.1 hypothetical protein [Flavobacteriaceae bacterium]
MKTNEKSIIKLILPSVLSVFLLLSFSCNQDVDLESELNQQKAASQSILKEFVKGAAIQGANGIDVGADGNLYIASVNGQEIVVMDKHNGKIINRFGPANGVLGPDDLVFGPDGTLYWTDILTGFVGRMTQDGQILAYQFVAPGVNPITFSDDGRLFVALDFLGDGLYELDPNLQEPPRAIIEATEGNPFPLGFFNSFDFGEDGRLYGPLFAAGLVISVDVGEAGDPVSTSPFTDGTAQIVAGGFVNPAAAKFGPNGMLYVLDQTGELFTIDPANGDTTLFTELQPGLDNMTFDTDGRLYMTNNDYGWVAEILKSGQARYISPGGFISAQGLAVLQGPDGKDALYAADLFRLRQFNVKSGQEENNFKGSLVPEGPESLILPMNVSADGDNLVISSWFSAGVQVWNPEDGVLESYPNLPVPIDAVRVNGDIIVSDFGLGGVVYASDNSPIASLEAASGLATDGETLWAADWGSGDVWQIEFDESGPTTTELLASGLVNPEGLALDGAGGMYVVESGASRLSRIDLASGNVTPLVDGLELFGTGLGAPPTWKFDGVAVGSNGDVYICGSGANVIYRIKKNKFK